jgi:hypothetical protein
MPRNASGTFSLVSGNPVVSGTLIDATWANNTLNDIANEMTDSLSRSGEGGMLAPLRLTDGVQATPGLGFTNEPGSGLYRAGTNEWWSVAGGAQVQQHTANGAVTRFAAGAVGTPSLSAFGDVNTGLWFPAADTLAASVGGVEGWRLTSAGSLGIGTASPRGNLDVSSGNLGGSQTRSIHLGYSAADFYGFRVANINDAGATFAGTFRIQRGVGSSWSDDVVLDNSGNLGIGTSSPGEKLDVNGGGKFGSGTGGVSLFTAAGLRHTGTGGLFFDANSGGAEGDITFRNGSGFTTRFQITAAGSVVAGIQTALATTATNGFLYVPTCAGTPTGTPTAITGMAPIVVNTTNNKLYFYSGGAWRDAGP